ncbi:patatin-like phospholipase family protein [Mucilaginibacter celer]|uniref:Patatin-like phospholipase family protein n=1 Tax=Mucilaginibacter celer TaxID=2305508 RepID=A0A494VYA2_9SPHI|nr:patatin-like phospholipase family protein [Mucilaginibacter celer]AYL96463.1 patatin-like phospholipase family protein [Mucilaginibacter celer]
MAQKKNQDQQVFYVGLCMAGAVSAGAYTAGVMDYLLEALTKWEQHRDEAGVPTHKVQIPVMGGASAGGMTSIMAASALNNPITPIDKPTADILAEHPENKLYHSWVDLIQADMFSKMLDPSDIKKDGKVISALNSDFINDIAKRVVSADAKTWQPLPPYIKPGIKLFTTLTNLEGYAYNVPFKASSPDRTKYNMRIHNDYACFELTEKEIKGPNNGWMPLDLKNKINIDVAADAAMATGAFPVGLQSRLLKRDAGYVNNNPWLKDYLTKTPVGDGAYQTLNVDGGMINNEPFDKVRSVLDDLTGQSSEDYNNFNKFVSTVLMIEPFPTQPPKAISLSRELSNVIGLTLSSMISQMRSKPVNIKDAMDVNCAGQYLITPSRRVDMPGGKSTDLTGELAIACGALSGFSGFLNKEFRVHDYFLGRHNCKIFLRDYFTVPAKTLDTNPIFKDGYANADKDRFKSHFDDSYQIIPVFEEEIKFPDIKFSSGTNWPTLKEKDIDRFEGPLKSRVQAIILNVGDFNWLTKGLLWIGAKAVLNRMISDKVIGAIKAELKKWKLLP